MPDSTDETPVLGRGLASLIPNRIAQDPVVKDVMSKTSDVFELPVGDIVVNRRQPRRTFREEDHDELVASVKRHGILQPLVVSESATGYELIAGERRLRAAIQAGMSTVPVIQRTASDQEKLELALIENIQRRDLNALERAAGYKQLMEDFDLTQDDVAHQLGLSRSAIGNTLRFLTLPAVAQHALIDGTITEGHGKILLGLGSIEQQERFLEQIIREGLSIRETAERAKPHAPPGSKRGRYQKRRDPNLLALEQEAESALKTRVRIHRTKGGGTIEISFYSDEELRRLLDTLAEDEG